MEGVRDGLCIYMKCTLFIFKETKTELSVTKH